MRTLDKSPHANGGIKHIPVSQSSFARSIKVNQMRLHHVRTILKLTTIFNDNPGLGSTAVASNIIDSLNYLDTLGNLTKHNMGTIQMRGPPSADKELRSVGILTGIGHGYTSHTSVLESEVLVLELVAVDGVTTPAITSGEITTLFQV